MNERFFADRASCVPGRQHQPGKADKLSVKQRYLPGHGHFGYFYQMRDICIGVYLGHDNAVKLKQTVYVKAPGKLLPVNVKPTVDFDGTPTFFGFWIKDYTRLLEFPFLPRRATTREPR